MHIMTSEEAQANFSKLIDSSQREPVLIVRGGKPVSFVISPDSDQKEALVEFLQVVHKLAPLTAWRHPSEPGNGYPEATRKPPPTNRQIVAL